ncbi:unnamed protein product [Rhizopus stolonifer]
MARLDPFIIYTIRLVMEKMSNDTRHTKKAYSATTIAQIMSIQAWPEIQFDKPSLKIDHLMSLLYHADEQWLTSSRELKRLADYGSTKIKGAEEQVHRQQRIYLDTLHLIQASMNPEFQKRYHEPIWFAAQVIHHQCHIRNLEQFSQSLSPYADQLYQALEDVRLRMRRILQKRPEASFFSFLSRAKTDDLTGLDLGSFESAWCQFEDVLYDCYVNIVFESHAPALLSQKRITDLPRPVLNERFHDPFTQLLPLTLERALERGLFDEQSVQCCEPMVLIALPRLAVLAGMTWLSHLTHWRTQSAFPVWIRPHATCLERVISTLESLESGLPKKPLVFVKRYQQLEHALVWGNQEQDTDLYLDICTIADSILAGPQAQAFSSVLGLLFRCYVNETLEYVFQGEQDAIPLEQTVLDLAI